MNKSWYLIRYKYGQAEQATLSLENNGVVCYSPKLSDFRNSEKITSREKDVFLFPPYLFINFNPNETSIEKIKFTRGVSGFVRFGNEIRKVPDCVMNTLFRVDGHCNEKVIEMIHTILKSEDKKTRVTLFLSLFENNK